MYCVHLEEFSVLIYHILYPNHALYFVFSGYNFTDNVLMEKYHLFCFSTYLTDQQMQVN